MPERTAQSARDAVLRRVRGVVGGAESTASVDGEWNGLPRGYRVATGLDKAEKIDLLVDRLRDYDAQVYRVSEGEIPATVRGIVEGLGVGQVLVPAGIDPAWIPEDPPLSAAYGAMEPTLAVKNTANVGHVAFVQDTEFAPHDLDQFTAVLTASTLAIAETGTLVLQNVPGQGRRAATLVPDVHLCVVRVADVVHTVPEAMRRLHATADLPTTFISGPSATADIEMTRIKGVHGPRFLHVLLVQ